MNSNPALPIDPRLVPRFRAAGTAIHWQELPFEGGEGYRLRISTLHEQPARVEERRTVAGGEMIVDSSPVGALVLVLEVDRRGLPQALNAVPAGGIDGFPDGALKATWVPGPAPSIPLGPTWKDVLDLARYALL